MMAALTELRALWLHLLMEACPPAGIMLPTQVDEASSGITRLVWPYLSIYLWATPEPTTDGRLMIGYIEHSRTGSRMIFAPMATSRGQYADGISATLRALVHDTDGDLSRIYRVANELAHRLAASGASPMPAPPLSPEVQAALAGIKPIDEIPLGDAHAPDDALLDYPKAWLSDEHRADWGRRGLDLSKCRPAQLADWRRQREATRARQLIDHSNRAEMLALYNEALDAFMEG